MNDSPTPASTRLTSLDIFRGATMAAMIVVNNPGDWDHVYSPLLHAPWHGCTPTDLIFPFFLFMVGAALPFSLETRIARQPRSELVAKILRRGVILFLIGFALGLFPDILFRPLETLRDCRIPGVLQRIAISYVAAALISIYFKPKTQAVIAFALIAIYSAGMFFFPVPGHGRGVFDVEGNFCWWVDRQLLFGHTYSGSPAKGFDPEGVWSTLTAIAGTQFGCFAGRLLRTDRDPYQKLTLLFVAGQLFLIGAYISSLWMPINKQLWTASYLFLVTGLALNGLGLLYYAADLRGMRLGVSLWLVFGTSSILAYVLSSLLGDIAGVIPVGDGSLKSWIVGQLGAYLSPKNASLTWAVALMAFIWMLIYPLYRANLKIRI